MTTMTTSSHPFPRDMPVIVADPTTTPLPPRGPVSDSGTPLASDSGTLHNVRADEK